MRTACVWGIVALLAGAQPQESPQSAPYKGWKEAFTLERSGERFALTAVPDLGGRIIRYGTATQNILFENPDYLGKTLANSNENSLAQGYIGYNIDLGPELRRIPRHLSLWVGPWAAKTEGTTLVLRSGADPAVGVRLEKSLAFDPTTGKLRLSQKLINASDKEQSYCLWDRTLCRGGGFAIVALNPKSRFKAGWSLLQKEIYQGESPSHPNVNIQDGVLVAEANGKSTKLGADTAAGWIAYASGKHLFVKYFPYFAGGAYTDGGNSVEIYFDPRVCELEPLSPEVKLVPGQEYEFPEEWNLIELDEEITTAAQARALARRIPASPFAH